MGNCLWFLFVIKAFPQRGANSPGGRQDTILPNFPENSMKSKEFGRPRGEGVVVGGGGGGWETESQPFYHVIF